MRKRLLTQILVLVLALNWFVVPSGKALTPTSVLPMSDTYRSSVYYQNLCSVTLTSDAAANLVAVARSQVGYREGANNYTEYGLAYKSPNAGWCAYFVSWCARQAGIPTSVLANYSYASVSGFGATSYWFYDTAMSNGGYTPKMGDLISFSPRESNRNSSVPSSHIGILIGYQIISSTQVRVNTIEGNTSDAVKEKNYIVDRQTGKISSDCYIRSIGAVNYSGTSVPPSTPTIQVSSSYQTPNRSVTIEWDAVSDAVSYEYYVSEYPEAYAYTENARTGFTSETSISFPDLPSGKYAAFIHATNAFGTQSEQSNWVSFSVYQSDYIPVKTASYNGHIYAVYDDELSWSFARSLCENMGGHLVTITSRGENEFVQNLIRFGKQDRYWLGGHNDVPADYQNTSYSYEWVTGEPFSYTDWFEGEPNGLGTGAQREHFIHMVKSYGYQWNDAYNTNKASNGFVLEIEPDEQYISATGDFNGHTYLIIDKGTTWTEAQAYCELLGGHLATFDSNAERSFVTALLPHGNHSWYFLGAQKVNGQWTWLGGNAVKYVTWNANEPLWDNDYLMIYNRSFDSVSFHNTYCPASDISHIGFICEIENTQTAPHAVSTVQRSGDSYTVETELFHIDAPCNIFVAGYKDCQLCSLKIIPYLGKATVCTLTGDIDEIKTMVLTSDGNLEPLCEAASVVPEQNDR